MQQEGGGRRGSYLTYYIVYSTISVQQTNLLPENASENNATFPNSRYGTASLERKMNAMLLCMKKAGFISDALYNRLRSSAGRLLLLYGLLKVHKPEVPLCLIVSFIHSPTYTSFPSTWPESCPSWWAILLRMCKTPTDLQVSSTHRSCRKMRF